MFSDMNKITQKVPSVRDPRPQETDTREEIRRHDPDQERKKGEHKNFAHEQGLFGDDQTEISVQSLETFLPMLLKNYTAKESFSSQNHAVEKVDQSTPNARAAGAYARMAQYSPVPALQDKARSAQDEKQKDIRSENPTLSNTEIQAIHRLQADVVKLKEKGVQAIYVNKAGTFLESLQNGVSEAL